MGLSNARNVEHIKFLVTNLCWRLSGTQEILNANRRNRSLENFQETYRGSNTEPPALWRNATTNRRTARTLLQMINIVVIFVASFHDSIFFATTRNE